MPIIGERPHLTHIIQDNYKLHDDLVYKDPVTQITHVVKAPFVWDMGTVMKWLPRWIVPHSDEMTYPSALHDRFYRDYAVTRAEADRIFRTFLLEMGMSKTRAWLAWAGVRLNLVAEWRWGNEE